ncbi:MAG: hypothetical protein WKG00_33085 [Polyangiaceae bacterium]
MRSPTRTCGTSAPLTRRPEPPPSSRQPSRRWAKRTASAPSKSTRRPGMRCSSSRRRASSARSAPSSRCGTPPPRCTSLPSSMRASGGSPYTRVGSTESVCSRCSTTKAMRGRARERFLGRRLDLISTAMRRSSPGSTSETSVPSSPLG